MLPGPGLAGDAPAAGQSAEAHACRMQAAARARDDLTPRMAVGGRSRERRMAVGEWSRERSESFQGCGFCQPDPLMRTWAPVGEAAS